VEYKHPNKETDIALQKVNGQENKSSKAGAKANNRNAIR
jgi:hypothetical protein